MLSCTDCSLGATWKRRLGTTTAKSNIFRSLCPDDFDQKDPKRRHTRAGWSERQIRTRAVFPFLSAAVPCAQTGVSALRLCDEGSGCPAARQRFSPGSPSPPLSQTAFREQRFYSIDAIEQSTNGMAIWVDRSIVLNIALRV